VLEAVGVRQQYERTIEASYDSANDHLVQAFGEYKRFSKENWDAVTISRKAREYLRAHWSAEKVALADAKEKVLPELKRWLQEQALGQFSNKALAEMLSPEDLPQEVHALARELAEFAGVSLP